PLGRDRERHKLHVRRRHHELVVVAGIEDRRRNPASRIRKHLDAHPDEGAGENGVGEKSVERGWEVGSLGGGEGGSLGGWEVGRLGGWQAWILVRQDRDSNCPREASDRAADLHAFTLHVLCLLNSQASRLPSFQTHFPAIAFIPARILSRSATGITAAPVSPG